MTDEHFDEAFGRMQAELNVTPSPEFVVKVRRQNEQMSSRRGWNVWAWTGVAATCAAVAIAVAVWPSPATEPQIETVQDRPQESFSPAQKPTPEVGFVTPPRAALHAGARGPRVGTTLAPGVPAAPKPETEMLVPPDQLMGIRQLMASVRRGADVQVAPSPTLFDPDTGELIKPKPIEIPLITVTPLPGDPEGRSGGRENR